jgi:hypothetical protein
MKTKQKTSAGQMMEATTTNGQCLIPGDMAGGIYLPRALQDDAHRLQDITSCAWIPGDPRDGRHAKIHQNLEEVPR